jgi:23S rRNA pseudouridine2605 synthase
LIEEAGANFEAPVVSQFPNQPVKRAPERKADEAERPRIERDGERGRIGEGGLIKRRHRRENSRDEALGKLSTRPERGARPAFGDRPDSGPKKFERGRKFGDGPRPQRGGKKEREQRPIEPPGQRKSNVWMASGARPIGTGRAAAERAEVEAKRAAKKAAYGKPAGGKPQGKPGFGKPRGDRPQGDRPQGDRPQDNRPRGDRPSSGRGGPRGRDADRRR